MEANTPADWRRIEAHLDAVLDGRESPPGCDDHQIRVEAERLLGYREPARDFLEEPASVLIGPLLSAELEATHPRPTPPRRIGPYRIIREAGRGGMATVYLAERAEPQLRHRVAVKVLDDAIASRSLVARFLHERQILASLEHPGIARLFDGGVTDDGLPWFAMEYVDGVPITHYCASRRLVVDARLELFLEVCDAVSYAHRNLVVHRDLKPANILVTDPDVERGGGSLGRVKLLDFGIAKLLGSDSASPGWTRTGLTPLTPEYASPEQLAGGPVSTASDVYQLGVLLYELLTGRRPHRLEDLPLHEIHRIVHQETPEPPSVAVSRSGRPVVPTDGSSPGSSEGAGRGCAGMPDKLRNRISGEFGNAEGAGPAGARTPHALRRRLRGDLDNIVLMALRAAPDRRYGSADRLADDIRRHLGHLPVSARADTMTYRAGKFVHRHRAGLAVATLAFLLLGVTAGALARQAGHIALERDRAEQATDFLVELFQGLEPLEVRGAAVLVPEVLRRGAERARVELDQPLLRARIFEAIADVYELQGLHADAEPLLAEALATRIAALGAGHLDVARSQQRLAELRYERGDYDSESLFRAAIATYEGRLGAEHPRLTSARIGLGLVLRARGSYSAADSVLRQTLAALRHPTDPNLDLPIALSFLGKLRTRAGDYEEAEALIREALAVRLQLQGPEHPAVANALDALGELELTRGDVTAAEPLFLEALAIRDLLYEDGHTDIASGRTYLARVRLEQGDLVVADSLLRQALPVFRRAFGPDSPDVAEVLEYLGVAARQGGDLVAADSLFQRALMIWQNMPIETTHDRPTTLLLRIGALRLEQGDLEGARAMLLEGVQRRRRALPAGHWRIAEAESWLGYCLSLLGNREATGVPLFDAYARIR